MKQLTRKRIRAALALAVIADALQLGLFPLFAEGVLSPLNDILDVVLAIAMLLLVGWHWAFLPSLVAEMVPAMNLFPTWTAAVVFVTRQGPGDVALDLPAGEVASPQLNAPPPPAT